MDRLNNELILNLLKGKSGDDRIARYVACVVVASPAGDILYAESAAVTGRVLLDPKGVKGFGFDPIMEFYDYPGRSVAELSMDEKNLVSHRGRVTYNLINWLARNY